MPSSHDAGLRPRKWRAGAPDWASPHTIALQQRGLEHGRAYIESLRARELAVVDLSDEPEETTAEATRAALEIEEVLKHIDPERFCLCYLRRPPGVGQTSARRITKVVVDTDVASYLFNWHSSAKALSDSLRGFKLVLSFLTVAELRTGAIAAIGGSGAGLCLSNTFTALRLPMRTNSMCTEWAKLRASSRVLGRAVSVQDAWIAASALDLKAPLATNNRNDVKHIKGLRLLFA